MAPPAFRLTVSALRLLALSKLAIAETAMHNARLHLEREDLEGATQELQLAAMRGEEAAKLIDELKGMNR